MQIAVSSLFNLTFKSLRTFSLNLAPFILGKSFDYEMNHSVVNCSYVSESHSKHDASEETTLLQLLLADLLTSSIPIKRGKDRVKKKNYEMIFLEYLKISKISMYLYLYCISQNISFVS